VFINHAANYVVNLPKAQRFQADQLSVLGYQKARANSGSIPILIIFLQLAKDALLAKDAPLSKAGNQRIVS
jgi:hypothetical protein